MKDASSEGSRRFDTNVQAHSPLPSAAIRRGVTTPLDTSSLLQRSPMKPRTSAPATVAEVVIAASGATTNGSTARALFPTERERGSDATSPQTPRRHIRATSVDVLSPVSNGPSPTKSAAVLALARASSTATPTKTSPGKSPAKMIANGDYNTHAIMTMIVPTNSSGSGTRSSPHRHTASETPPSEHAGALSVAESGGGRLPTLGGAAGGSANGGSPTASRSRGRSQQLAGSGTSEENCLTSYHRDYDLAVSDKPPPKDTAVNRYIPTMRPPIWSSNFKGADTSPREELPKIGTTRATKYDRLSTGGTTSPSRRGSSQLLGYRSGRLLSGSGSGVSTLYPVTTALHSYKDELHSSLERIDFGKAFSQEENGLVEGADYRMALEVFKIVSHGKLHIEPEDLHELLLLFTPTGVSLHEATDFLHEECEDMAHLSFPAFLVFGERLLYRILDYENFNQLDNSDKMLVTYSRIFPGQPPDDVECARVRLLKAHQLQMEDALPSTFRPLRVYEHLFLVDYQAQLFLEGAINGNEVPPDVLGDFSHDHTHKARRDLTAQQQKVRHHQKAHSDGEDIEWGSKSGSATCSPSSVRSNRAVATTTNKDYPSLAKCNERTQQQNAPQRHTNSNGTIAKRSHVAPKATAAVVPLNKGTTASPRVDTSGRGTFPGSVSIRSRLAASKANRRNRQSRPPFQAGVKSGAAVQQDRKILGRPVEEDFVERRRDDSQLIRSLQAKYGVSS